MSGHGAMTSEEVQGQAIFAIFKQNVKKNGIYFLIKINKRTICVSCMYELCICQISSQWVQKWFLHRSEASKMSIGKIFHLFYQTQKDKITPMNFPSNYALKQTFL